jgi:hypothetical protein
MRGQFQSQEPGGKSARGIDRDNQIFKGGAAFVQLKTRFEEE